MLAFVESERVGNHQHFPIRTMTENLFFLLTCVDAVTTQPQRPFDAVTLYLEML